MAQCLNCKSNMGCGCNKRTASDGTSCCTKCIGAYESSKTKPQTVKNITRANSNVKPTSSVSPIITGVQVKIPK